MACHLLGAKPLSKPMLVYGKLQHYEQISVKFQSKFKHFFEENAFENVVCQSGDQLSRSQCVEMQENEVIVQSWQ